MNKKVHFFNNGERGQEVWRRKIADTYRKNRSLGIFRGGEEMGGEKRKRRRRRRKKGIERRGKGGCGEVGEGKGGLKG